MLMEDAYAEGLSSQASVQGEGKKGAPFRPIQYLGNKLRALPEILDAAENLIGKSDQVADLFTGTTVVAQAFAAHGYSVAAIDSQAYSRIFAQALLGIGRGIGESCSFSEISDHLRTTIKPDWRQEWEPFVEREEKALNAGDADALDLLTNELPLIWRNPRHPLHAYLCVDKRRSALGEIPLLTSLYAGFYFGVRQALALDELRQKIELAREAGHLSEWQYSAALTAVLAAASSAAHSAGKHFAQPLNVGSRSNVEFLSTRLVQDRNISVLNVFKQTCDLINNRPLLVGEVHAAYHCTAETYVAGPNSASLYYLDPPYTAQQYSRFYHVLETICGYEYPQLISDGKITTGLYPTARYKSAFSSKRKAPNAFRTLIEAARANGTALLISYSRSSANSNGNARMISLQELLSVCSAEYGAKNVDWLQLGHRYRQFNSAAASSVNREDPEILITCKRP